jgi:hypothetical protein
MVLSVFIVPLALADVEVVVNGRSYASVEEYKIMNRTALKQLDPEVQSPAELKKNGDVQAMAAVEVLHQINQQPPENPFVWHQSWDNPKPQCVKSLNKDDLALVLENVATQDEKAKLIVNRDHQLKVLSVTEEALDNLGFSDVSR